MRADYLHYILEVDRLHSISMAAHSLYLAQTSLSTIVKNVEEELGFPIFERTHNGVQTTPEGEEALAFMWDIDCRLEQIRQLKKMEEHPSLPVTIITSPTISSAISLPVNRLLLEREPAGNLVFQAVPGESVGPMLIQNDANIGLTYFSEEGQKEFETVASRYQMETETMFVDHMYLLVPTDHPLASQNSVSCRELEHLNIAMLSHYKACEDSLVYSSNFGQGNRYITMDNIALIKQAVLRRSMVAVLSGFSIQNDPTGIGSKMKALRITGLKEENSVNLTLIYRTGHYLSYQEKTALQCIREYFRNTEFSPLLPAEDGIPAPQPADA